MQHREQTGGIQALCTVATVSLGLQRHSGIARMAGVLPRRDPAALGVIRGEGGEGIALYVRAAGMCGALPRDG